VVRFGNHEPFTRNLARRAIRSKADMRIECDNCGAKYSIADEKVAGRMIRLRCKKCGNNIRVDGTAVSAASEEAEDATRVFDPSAAGDWYVVINGEQSGPLSESDLYEQVQVGAVTAESLAWRDGMADWQAVVDIEELASVLGFADTGGVVEEEEATRVVAAPSESAAPEPFSFAGRPSALSESFAPAPVAAAPTPAPAPAPEPARAAVDNDAFFASSSAAPDSDNDASMTGQRKESSVLFSLSDLTSTRTATQKNEALPRTEGSGLIDIRVLAQSQAAVGGGSAGTSNAGSEAAPPMATRQMVPIVPMPVRRSNGGLYAILAVGGLIVVGLAVAVIVLLFREEPPPAPVPVAVAPVESTPDPAEASAPVAVAVAEPEAPSEGSVVVVPDEGSAAAEGSAMAEANPAEEPEAEGTPTPSRTETAVAARTQPSPSERETPTPRPTRTERTPTPEPTPEPTPREAAPASARDVIANLNRNTATPTATPTPTPTPAAAPDVPASLSRSEVQTTIRRYRSRIAGCNGANQAGTYRVSFRVAPSGSTENVSVDNSDSIGSCLTDVVRGMTFPRNGGETPPVTYPFSF
jgi:predicted Zn finger-like uncharacterized protein